jgi:hypothetical protein
MKWQELLETMDPLLPADFFSYELSIPYLKDLGALGKTKPLVDVSDLLDEEKFADLFLGWNEEGIVGKVTVYKPFKESCFPAYEKGDSLEVFISTREIKKGNATRFCHHFVFLAGEVQGITAQEVTRFRSEDSHPLCNASDLVIQCDAEKDSYVLQFQISENALHGFDPEQFPKLYLAYRMNRFKSKPQHFPFSSERFDMLANPSLWASITLQR